MSLRATIHEESMVIAAALNTLHWCSGAAIVRSPCNNSQPIGCDLSLSPHSLGPQGCFERTHLSDLDFSLSTFDHDAYFNLRHRPSFFFRVRVAFGGVGEVMMIEPSVCNRIQSFFCWL